MVNRVDLRFTKLHITNAVIVLEAYRLIRYLILFAVNKVNINQY